MSELTAEQTRHLSVPRAMFGIYALVGAALWCGRLPEPQAQDRSRSAPLGPSRGIVTRLALLFSVDAFAGGLVLNSLLSLWLKNSLNKFAS